MARFAWGAGIYWADQRANRKPANKANERDPELPPRERNHEQPVSVPAAAVVHPAGTPEGSEHRQEGRAGDRGLHAALAIIGGISDGGSHSDSWHLGYENSQTAKSFVKAGMSPRAACRGSLTVPDAYDYDDVIDGCIRRCPDKRLIVGALVAISIALGLAAPTSALRL